ncbi:MAG: CBS domain-containing protein [Acidimicrobiales bacterium]|nr:CBS domain-containing protein [Acidimicrobiales bacterium]
MPRENPVSSVMTTEVVTLSPDDNAYQAMEKMVASGVDGAPVVDAQGAVVGILSTGDLIVQESRLHFPTVLSIFGATIELPGEKRQFEDDLRKALGSTVADVMQPDPVTIGVEDTVEEAATLMHEHDVSRLPVIGDSGLVGIVARFDILRAIISADRLRSADDSGEG